ncbi:MAG: hypothetical protein ACLFQV_12655, partial [Vulcanimicrobiota bacterium]
MSVRNVKIQKGEKIKIENHDCYLEAYISPYNERIRLINYKGPAVDKVARELIRIHEAKDFSTKIFCKIKERHAEAFIETGFVQEGVIHNYFDKQNAVVVSYLEDERFATPEEILQKEKDIEKTLQEQKVKTAPKPLPGG